MVCSLVCPVFDDGLLVGLSCFRGWSARWFVLFSTMVCSLVCPVFEDGLVGGLSCFSESLEEELPCGPKLGILVEVAVLDGVELAAFKTVEVLRETFFFSAIVRS